MGIELVLFLIIGGLAVVCAIGMLLSENAIYSALFLIGNFACVALLFLLLDAPFLAMVQIAVYAGAIMVLFLFVIMLLGAEETSDTTRHFRWLAGGATGLALLLVLIFGVPLVSGSFELPDYEGEAPQVRIIHAADVPPVHLDVANAAGETVLRLEDADFATTTDFETLPAGDYSVALTLAEQDVTILNQSVTLENDQIVSVVASGVVDLEQSIIDVQLGVIPHSLAPAERQDHGRLIVYNVYSQAPLTLLDLGPNDVIDTVLRDVEVETEAGETATQTIEAIADPILVEDLAYRAEPAVITYPEGASDLAFIEAGDPEREIVLRLFDFEIDDASEHLILLAAEPLFDGDSRAKVLDVDEDGVSDGLDLAISPSFGGPQAIGQVLFVDYVLPVQMVGMLLLVALVGVVVLTRPFGQTRTAARQKRRRRVSRPLVNVISQQTGSDVLQKPPQLPSDASGD